jgi:hypothetical protein
MLDEARWLKPKVSEGTVYTSRLSFRGDWTFLQAECDGGGLPSSVRIVPPLEASRMMTLHIRIQQGTHYDESDRSDRKSAESQVLGTRDVSVPHDDFCLPDFVSDTMGENDLRRAKLTSTFVPNCTAIAKPFPDYCLRE